MEEIKGKRTCRCLTKGKIKKKNVQEEYIKEKEKG